MKGSGRRIPIRFRATQLINEALGADGEEGRSAQGYNFGVGGYNTVLELVLLRRVLDYDPDLVVLGYTLNDAEPPLYRFASETRIERTDPTGAVEAADLSGPPEGLLMRSRAAQLLWQALRERRRERRTERYYRSLYAEGNAGWVDGRKALARIVELCRARGIECVVVCFPVLDRLDGGYAFGEIHSQVETVVKTAGGTFIDLLPELLGEDATGLWVPRPPISIPTSGFTRWRLG